MKKENTIENEILNIYDKKTLKDNVSYGDLCGEIKKRYEKEENENKDFKIAKEIERLETYKFSIESNTNAYLIALVIGTISIAISTLSVVLAKYENVLMIAFIIYGFIFAVIARQNDRRKKEVVVLEIIIRTLKNKKDV